MTISLANAYLPNYIKKKFMIIIKINMEISYGRWSKRKNADCKSSGKTVRLARNYRNTNYDYSSIFKSSSKYS